MLVQKDRSAKYVYYTHISVTPVLIVHIQQAPCSAHCRHSRYQRIRKILFKAHGDLRNREFGSVFWPLGYWQNDACRCRTGIREAPGVEAFFSKLPPQSSELECSG